jgi:hypothetical protein
MMNELMDMIQVGCEESISAADEARMEHERGEREREERERKESWADLVAIHGPLMTDAEWKNFVAEYGVYLDMAWKD